MSARPTPVIAICRDCDTSWIETDWPDLPLLGEMESGFPGINLELRGHKCSACGGHSTTRGAYRWPDGRYLSITDPAIQGEPINTGIWHGFPLPADVVEMLNRQALMVPHVHALVASIRATGPNMGLVFRALVALADDYEKMLSLAQKLMLLQPPPLVIEVPK